MAQAERFARQCRRDDGDPSEYVGFRLHLLPSGRSLSLSIHCGAGRSGPGTGNSVALFFPEPAPATARRYGPDTVRDLVTAVAEVWQPQWVTFADSLPDTRQSETRRRRPVGFLTWTPGPTAPVLADHPHLASELLAHGTLMTRPQWCGSPARGSVSERR
ncbi:hypothetical protein [Streptomyces flaveolus]|uniref:hypothetical protein n=1 Tax=Streptomyces flaveolus TaxID=67297 RepID=UPI003701AC86